MFYNRYFTVSTGKVKEKIIEHDRCVSSRNTECRDSVPICFMQIVRCCLHPAAGKQMSTGHLYRIIRISEHKRKNQKEQMLFLVFWSECRDSNSRPLEPHSSAIPNFATPGTICAVSLTTSTYYHVIRKMSSANFHFFHFLSPISRNQREMGKLQTYSPRSLVTTLPMFHRWATACSASFFS